MPPSALYTPMSFSMRRWSALTHDAPCRLSAERTRRAEAPTRAMGAMRGSRPSVATGRHGERNGARLSVEPVAQALVSANEPRVRQQVRPLDALCGDDARGAGKLLPREVDAPAGEQIPIVQRRCSGVLVNETAHELAA